MDEESWPRRPLNVPVVPFGPKAQALVSELVAANLLGRMETGGIVSKSGWGGFVPVLNAVDFHEDNLTWGFATIIVADGEARRDELELFIGTVRRHANHVLGAGLDIISSAYLTEFCDNVLFHSPDAHQQVKLLVKFLWTYLFTPGLVGVDIADLKPLLRKRRGFRMGVGCCDRPEELPEAGRNAVVMAGARDDTPAIAFSIVKPDDATLYDMDLCAQAVAEVVSDETDILFCSPLNSAKSCEVLLLAVQ